MSRSSAKFIRLAIVIVVVVLLSGLADSPDVEVFGVALPAWLVAMACYFLGVGAGLASTRPRPSVD